MTGRAVVRAGVAMLTLGIATGLTCTTAAADPGVIDTHANTGLAALARQADANPADRAGVAALVQSAHTTDIAGAYAPFLYASPTQGCGDGKGPFTFTAATGMGDGDVSSLRFQATPAYSGVPTASHLSIAWVNLDTGASGITPVDGMTEYDMPSLSKTVHTGPGTIVASMWGSVNYTDAICAVAPTVGEFAVDQPTASA